MPNELLARLKEIILEKSYEDDDIYHPRRHHPASRDPLKISSSTIKKIVLHDEEVKKLFLECRTVAELETITNFLTNFYCRESNKIEFSIHDRKDFFRYYAVDAIPVDLLDKFCQLVRPKPDHVRFFVIPEIIKKITEKLKKTDLNLRDLRTPIHQLIILFRFIKADLSEYVNHWLVNTHSWEGDDELTNQIATKNKKRLLKALKLL